MVKKRQEAGLVQLRHPNLTSQVLSKLFRSKSQKMFDSALYRIGHDEKSIFWYWEIDYKLRQYREFRTTDLAKGEKRFKEEIFAS